VNAFEELFSSIRTERGVNRDSVIAAIEAALLAAYRTNVGAKEAAYARAIFDPASGSMIVERLRDLHAGDLPRPGIDVIDGPDGREIAVVDWTALPDDEREVIELDSARFGRVAAIAAKDALRREVRGSEQKVLHARYGDRIGTLALGVVGERVSAGLLVKLEDAEAILPFSERAEGPLPHTGDRIAAVIVDVSAESVDAQVRLSQTDPRFVKAVFAYEVAEIADGRIELTRVARRPGVRSKVAVAYRADQRADGSAVGACIGERGSRIRLIRELLGEELDLMAFTDDPITFVAEALAPAKVRRVERDGDGFVAIVSEDEQERIPGADGLGLALATELVGAPIVVRVDAATAESADADADAEGICTYIRPNGRRCVNAADPGSDRCGLPGHQHS
jgi:N utilization substance protein A